MERHRPSQAYAGHESILVAEVDCTSSGKKLCDEEGVEGFPTLRHGWDLRAWSCKHLEIVFKYIYLYMYIKMYAYVCIPITYNIS